MKKGFVFMETLIVLVVLLITVIGMYSVYVRLSTNIENRKYYDTINDLYKTNTIRDLVDTTSLEGKTSLVTIDSSNCTLYMETSCTNILTDLNVEKIYINFEQISSLISSYTFDLPNSAKEYLKTINKDEYERYIIVNYKKNNKNFYASLRI